MSKTIDTKKLIVSTALSGLAMFLLSGVWNIVIVKDLINQIPIARATPWIALVVTGYFVLALLMSFLYPNLHPKASAMTGLLFGFFMGMVWMFPLTLVLYGVYDFPVGTLMLDVLWALVEQGLGGLVIGYSASILEGIAI